MEAECFYLRILCIATFRADVNYSITLFRYRYDIVSVRQGKCKLAEYSATKGGGIKFRVRAPHVPGLVRKTIPQYRELDTGK